MQKPANLFLLFSAASLLSVGVQSQPQQGKVPPSDMASTVGEIVRNEAARALSEARKLNASEVVVVAPVQTPPPQQKGAIVNTDLIELLGTVNRSGSYSADLAINGSVMKVVAGSKFGAYQVKAIAGNCLYLYDSARKELLRCVFNQPN